MSHTADVAVLVGPGSATRLVEGPRSVCRIGSAGDVVSASGYKQRTLFLSRALVAIKEENCPLPIVWAGLPVEPV